ncbi:hypothetical protein MX572_24980 (plasmid) [Rhodococcus pyridinivorans]|uniref:hypothetical protein n=1 Tax=Rhodococcus pyridinivorans TaxID=103816 RepID=UPI0020C73B62|nr:hypothetical protein [Rhodococcus pyridinivorans]UTM40021.1 hypothetical protein MX572_24980 [Rhodococcus pyridinivorans]
MEFRGLDRSCPGNSLHVVPAELGTDKEFIVDKMVTAVRVDADDSAAVIELAGTEERGVGVGPCARRWIAGNAANPPT